MVKEMEQAGVRPNNVALTKLMSAQAAAGQFAKCRATFERAKQVDANDKQRDGLSVLLHAKGIRFCL